MCCYPHESPWGGELGKFLGNPNRLQTCSFNSAQDHKEILHILKCINLTSEIYFPYFLLLFPSPFHFEHLIFSFRKYVLDYPGLMFFVNLCLDMVPMGSIKLKVFYICCTEGGRRPAKQKWFSNPCGL